MSQKRAPDEGDAGGSGGGSPDEKRPRVPAIRGFMIEALKTDAFQKLLSALEPLVRRIVKEEIELALGKHLLCTNRESEQQTYEVPPRTLQLQFLNKLFLPIYTYSKIEAEDHSILNIAVVDCLSGQIVTSGPESFMKVEIVVLDGEFQGVDGDWSFEDFQSSVVNGREGKKPLLMGNVVVDLKDGVGALGELVFSDNSSWIRSRKFRLGANTAGGYFDGIRVREARTEAFIVKDHRGESYKKHYPPSLTDEVWRIEKIGKDGAFHKRLSSENINTVNDFLFLLTKDATKLRNILGSGMSAKMWEVTVEHARTCMLGNQVHLYYPNAESKTGVVFNILGEVLGVLCEQQYLAYDGFTDDLKFQTQQLVEAGFEHWDKVIPCDLGSIMSSFGTEPSFFSKPHILEDVYGGLNLTSAVLGFTHSSLSSLDSGALQAMCGAESEHNPTDYHLLNHNSLKRSQEETKDYNNFLFNDAGCEQFFADGAFQFLDPDELLSQSLGGTADSPADLGTAVTGFLAMSARTVGSRPFKAYGCWKTLISVLRWRFSIKRIIALKKNRLRQKQS